MKQGMFVAGILHLLFGSFQFMAAHAQDGTTRDTMRAYSLVQGTVHYSHERSTACAGRFPIPRSCSLVGLRLYMRVEGDTGTFRVRVLGPNGGASVPSDAEELAPPMWVSVGHGEAVATSVAFPEPIQVMGDQFFISVDSANGVSLLSDAVLREPLCTCTTDIFARQCLRARDGSWKSGPYAFLIEPIVDLAGEEENMRFVNRSAAYPGGAPQDMRHSVLAGDLDGDAWPDVVTPRAVYLGPLSQGASIRTHEWPQRTNEVAERVVSSLMIGRRVHAVELLSGGDRFSCEESVLHGIPLVTCILPGARPIAASLAVVDASTRSEVLVVAQSRSSQAHAGAISVIRKTDDHWSVTSAELPAAAFVHGLAAAVVEGSAQPSIVVTATDERGMPQSFMVDISASVPTVSTLDRNHIARVVNPPVLSALGRVDHADGDLEVNGMAMLTSAVSARGIRLFGMTPSTIVNHDDREHFNGIDIPDRASSMSFVDVDMDGADELFVTTSDSCRGAQLYKKTRDDHWQRIRVPGLEVLAGAQDVAWVDMDRDGLLDAVGYRTGSLVLALNRSVKRSSTTSAVTIPSDITAGASSYRVADGTSIRHVVGVTGRGRGVHERASIAFATDRDTIVVTRNVGGSASEVVIRRSHETETAATAGNESGECFVRVHPNPFSSSIDFFGDAAREVDVAIVSTDGRVVWSSNVGGNGHQSRISWDGRDAAGNPVASGVYSVRTQRRQCVSVTTIVKVQ